MILDESDDAWPRLRRWLFRDLGIAVVALTLFHWSWRLFGRDTPAWHVASVIALRVMLVTWVWRLVKDVHWRRPHLNFRQGSAASYFFSFQRLEPRPRPPATPRADDDGSGQAS